ncbi:MAG: GntR family transcriptional regulator [Clostridiales bacterium]|nr:GntR family transcriptional regulator [Clostridiales bacterium]
MELDEIFNYNKLDKNLPIPLYYQIKQMILEAIKKEKIVVGDMIPTELDLCERCKVSRPTVRQAISELVSEGYLYRLKGKGTFVAKPKIQAMFLNKLLSFNEEMNIKGLTPSTKVLDLKVVADNPSINSLLNLSERDKLIYLERVRYANDEPIVYLKTYIPYEPYSDLLNQDFVHNSLYAMLEDIYNKRVTRVHRKIEAVNATRKEAELLEISKGDAISRVRTLAYTKDDETIEYSIAKYRGDRNEFSVELYR